MSLGPISCNITDDGVLAFRQTKDVCIGSKDVSVFAKSYFGFTTSKIKALFSGNRAYRFESENCHTAMKRDSANIVWKVVLNNGFVALLAM